MDLSSSDHRLLNALQTDATHSQSDLAELVGMSRTSCWRRIRELEAAGLIEKRVALLDPILAGFQIHVLLAVTMVEHTDLNRDAFEQHIQGLRQVMQGYSISGDRDYMLVVVARDMADYNNFLNAQILSHPAVRSASSTFTLRRVKYTTQLPL